MPATLGDAYVHIIPTTEGISDSITKALGGESEKAGTSAGKSMVGGIAKVVGGGAAALVGAAAAITGTMVSGAKEVAVYGDNIDKMSQKIGISAQAYQKWDYVLARAGTSVDVMKSGMKTLSAQAQSNSDAFKELGITQEELKGMSNEELFQRTVEKLSSMEEGTERTTLATKLLGKAGLEMGPLFNEGTDAIREQMEMADQYGMVMSDDLVAASATFQDSMETLGRTMGGWKNQALGELLPAMTEVTDGLAQIFSGDTEEGVEKLSQGIQDLVAKVADAAPQFLETGGMLIQSLAKAILDNAPTLLSNTASLMLQMFGKIKENLPQILERGKELITFLANGIVQNTPSMLNAMLNGMVQLIATIAQHLPEILQKGLELLGQFIAGIIQAIPQIPSAISQVIDAVKEAFSQYDWAEIGRNLIEGIKNGITAAASLIKEAALEAAKQAFQAVKDFFGIKSPSRLMRDEIGRFIPAGIAEGIEDASGMVTSAMEDVGGRITDSARGWSLGVDGMAAGIANNYGGFVINIYQAPGQDAEELVDIVETRINEKIMSRQAVFA